MACVSDSRAEAPRSDHTAATWLALGQSLAASRRFDDALVAFAAAANADDTYPGLHAARAVVLFQLGHANEALADYMAALQLDPGDADTWLNLGVLYQASGYFAEALSCFETALTQRPRFIAAWSNRAKAQRQLGDAVGARASFAEAHRLDPDNAMTRSDLAMTDLMLGEWNVGWAGYEARLAVNAEPRILTSRWPVWRGEALDGKRIVVLSEQGLGDIFQFARFIRDLQMRGANVTLRLPETMLPVMAGLAADVRLVHDLESDAQFDFEIAMMSLPHRLSPDAIVSPDPLRYLAPDPVRVAKWRDRLGTGMRGVNIGIGWQGNPAFIDDARRSIPLDAFAAIAERQGIRLVSLQKHAGAEQLAEVAFPVERVPDDIDADGAFVDTAAIIDCLDLVITSDTALAHLAGALGHPVWLALPFVPDWRWGTAGETTPWYPTMRLFRQRTDGDWGGVFARMCGALEGLISRAE